MKRARNITVLPASMPAPRTARRPGPAPHRDSETLTFAVVKNRTAGGTVAVRFTG